MSENQAGFNQEQLVIYKLGQIESSLAALVMRLTDLTSQYQKEIKDLDDRTQLDIKALDSRTAKLEEANTNIRIERAKTGAVVGAVVTVFLFFKEVIIKWLNLPF